MINPEYDASMLADAGAGTGWPHKDHDRRQEGIVPPSSMPRTLK